MTPTTLVAQDTLSPRSLRQAAQPSASTAYQGQGHVAAIVGAALPDDLARELYCVFGVPIDAIDMAEALRRIRVAAANGAPYLVSTPNLNFLISSRSDADFRESLLQSDLCPADGMPIVWLARLIGIPIRKRIAGSDIFEALKAEFRAAHPLKVFLFGGASGIAAAAGDALNASQGGLTCVGSLYPGFGTVDHMSRDEVIDAINASRADFLVLALSSGKGQAWLRQNHSRLRIPVRSHLGATVNFQAGTVRRAPAWMRKLGLEWLWRIKEEPHLLKRYGHDGTMLLRVLLTRVLPLAVVTRWQKWRHGQDLVIKRAQDDGAVSVSLSGAATAPNVDKAIGAFRDAIAANKPIAIDLSGIRVIDARFLGLLLMLRKQAKGQGTHIHITGVSRYVARLLRLNCAEFLLSSDGAT